MISAVSRRRALLLLGMGVVAAAGCHRTPPGRTRIATSVFAVYDLARRVAGPDADVVLVRAPGSPERLAGSVAVGEARADLAIAVGLGFDPWMDQTLAPDAPKARMLKVGDRVPTLGLADAGDVDAAQAPHVWLDPQRAQLIVRAIAEELGRIDGAHVLGYRARATEVDGQLAALDKELEARTRALAGKPIAVSSDTFRYFAERYGLDLRYAPGGQAAAFDAYGGREGSDTYEKLLRHDVAALESSRADPHGRAGK